MRRNPILKDDTRDSRLRIDERRNNFVFSFYQCEMFSLTSKRSSRSWLSADGRRGGRGEGILKDVTRPNFPTEGASLLWCVETSTFAKAFSLFLFIRIVSIRYVCLVDFLRGKDHDRRDRVNESRRWFPRCKLRCSAKQSYSVQREELWFHVLPHMNSFIYHAWSEGKKLKKAKMKNGSTVMMTETNRSWVCSKGEKYSLEVFVGLSSVKETQRCCFLMSFSLEDECR